MDRDLIIVNPEHEHIDLMAIQPAYRWTLIYDDPRYGTTCTMEGYCRTQVGARGALAEAKAAVAQFWSDYQAQATKREAA
jgi:hypothetical protein